MVYKYRKKIETGERMKINTYAVLLLPLTVRSVMRSNDLNLIKVTFCGCARVCGRCPIFSCSLSSLIQKISVLPYFNFMVSFQIEMKILLFKGYEIRCCDSRQALSLFISFASFHLLALFLGGREKFRLKHPFYLAYALLFQSGNGNSSQSFS